MSPIRKRRDSEGISYRISNSTNHVKQTLWQLALQNLSETDLTIYKSLLEQITRTLGFDVTSLLSNFSQEMCDVLYNDITSLGDTCSVYQEQWMEVIFMSENVSKIVLTVGDQLGLSVAGVGWSCVYTVLAVSVALMRIITS